MKFDKKLLVATDCSGIEAPIQALEQMKVSFSHLWSCDIDPYVYESIKINYNPKKFYKDIFSRNHKNLPKTDIYIAGFPCQTFSSLGKRDGFKDKRGTVFNECLETIKNSSPKVFILENVKGLLTHDNGKTFDFIIKKLNNVNKKTYNIYYKVLNTVDYNLPQHRQRIYIIGIKKKYERKNFLFPDSVPLKKKINVILEKNLSKDKIKKLSFLTEHKKKLLKDLVSNKKIDNLNNNWFVNLNVSSVNRTGAKKNICPCLLAGEGGNCTYYLTSIKRKLTPREYLRLQGFSDSFKINVPERQIYKMVGNSMSVNVLKELFSSIFYSVDFS